MDENTGTPDFTALTAEVVSAYVANNSLRPADIPDLISSVHRAMQGLSAPQQAEPEKREPPVPVKKSITPEFLISLEDGRRYKTLRRHLKGRGLTPEQYREKWGLPLDYPMVAPNYAKQRSDLAKTLGLGQIRRGRAAGGDGASTSAAGADQGGAEVQSGEPQKRRGRSRQKTEA
jgi:predicted transcriptional regulator